jgi:hypothetical protein
MRRLRRVAAIAVALVLVSAGGAAAIRGEFGSTVISSTAQMLPRELPAKGGAPIALTSVTRVGSSDGEAPPALSAIEFLIDKHGFIEAKGVPVCTVAKLEGTTPKQARKRCAGALVGKGIGRARVELPGQPARQVSSPLSLFNGPRIRGQASLIAHAYERVPAPKTLLVPIPIEKIHKGRYGYRVAVEVPEIAAGYGAPTLAEAKVGRTWKRHGKRVGYLNASCSGGRLQVQGNLRFGNGDFFPATLTSACHVPR